MKHTHPDEKAPDRDHRRRPLCERCRFEDAFAFEQGLKAAVAAPRTVGDWMDDPKQVEVYDNYQTNYILGLTMGYMALNGL